MTGLPTSANLECTGPPRRAHRRAGRSVAAIEEDCT
jgi:hypothetical protein